MGRRLVANDEAAADNAVPTGPEQRLGSLIVSNSGSLQGNLGATAQRQLDQDLVLSFAGGPSRSALFVAFAFHVQELHHGNRERAGDRSDARTQHRA